MHVEIPVPSCIEDQGADDRAFLVRFLWPDSRVTDSGFVLPVQDSLDGFDFNPMKSRDHCALAFPILEERKLMQTFLDALQIATRIDGPGWQIRSDPYSQFQALVTTARITRDMGGMWRHTCGRTVTPWDYRLTLLAARYPPGCVCDHESTPESWELVQKKST